MLWPAGLKWQGGVGWAGLTILGPHWVPDSTRPKSGRSRWVPGSTKAPLQVTWRLPRGMVESTGTMCGASALCSPPWHCSFPHCASLGTKCGVVKQRGVSPYPLPQLPLPPLPTSAHRARSCCRPAGRSSHGRLPQSSLPGNRPPGLGGSLREHGRDWGGGQPRPEPRPFCLSFPPPTSP